MHWAIHCNVVFNLDCITSPFCGKIKKIEIISTSNKVRYTWKYYKHYKKVGHIPGHRQILPSTHLVFYRLFKKPLRTLFPFLAPYLLDRYEFLVKVIGKWFRDNESARVMSIVSLDEAVIVIRFSNFEFYIINNKFKRSRGNQRCFNE